MFNSKSKHTYFEKKKKRKKGNKLNATCIEKLYCQFKTVRGTIIGFTQMGN